MNRTIHRNNYYQNRLELFLERLSSVQNGPKREELYVIMDMPVFRDVETALMIATMDQEAHAS